MVSRATVYNTLNLLVEKGLLKQLTLAEGRVVFDPNMERHHHFIDEVTGTIHGRSLARGPGLQARRAPGFRGARVSGGDARQAANWAATAQVTQTWAPDAYRTKAGFVAKLGRDLVALLDPKPGERVLDLGSGTGELTAELAATGASVLGIDSSAEMVEAARRSLPGLEFAVGDGQRLAFEAEFDAVFSNAALHWMPDADAVAHGIARALQPRGRFRRRVRRRRVRRHSSARRRQSSFERAARTLRRFHAGISPNRGAVRDVLDRAGFEPRMLHLFERPTPLEGENGLGDCSVSS
jgi:SAM-dependent methyltransferase